MSLTAASLPAPAIVHDGRDGPLTRARLRRTFLIYLVIATLGLVLGVLGDTPAVKALGLGLVVPGGGFVSLGGWAILWLPLSLLLFSVSLVAWFGAGMGIAPPLVWILSALLASAFAGDAAWPGAPYLVFAAALLFQIAVRVAAKRQRAADLRKRDERNAYLPAAVAAIKAYAVAKPPMDERELSPGQIGALRYCLDRALQPVGQLKGFTKIDQFQTAALRYQLNSLGYLLSTVQCQVTPNFHGYMSEAQRRVIEQYLERPIWSYWRLENLWGNLNPDPNPVGKDNIMLTGFFGINLGLYISNTGDRRYAQAGSLPFRWNDKTVFEHDFHSVAESIVWNMRRNSFCLFPCEPNWIYTPCNFRGITTLLLHDRLFGTAYYEEVADQFFHQLQREFTKPSGSLYALRSSWTGLPVPFPFEESGRTAFDNAIDQDMSRQDWAITRHELIRDLESGVEIKVPGNAVDFGNYQPGQTLLLGMLLQAAREMGDERVANAIQQKIDQECGRKMLDGVLSYQGSNTANLCVHSGILCARDDWRDTVRQGPPASAFSGPLLSEASYPDVLVARAWSPDACALDLVLYDGKAPGRQSLGLERLQADAAYRVTTPAGEQSLKADGRGRAELSVLLQGRTPVTITPIA